MNLIQRFKAWRKRRYWQRQQLEHLAMMIRSDWRWLAHDPVARALTDRYVRALRDDWYTMPHEDSGAFRTRIGLDALLKPPALASDHVDAERYRKLREVLQGAVGSGVEFCDAKLVYEEPTPGKEWRIFWYPDSPVSFYQVSGASLDEAVDQLLTQT